MSRIITITITDAGVTDFAAGETSERRRVIVQQPTSEDRLAVGDVVHVEDRFARAPRITEWTWADPWRRRLQALVS